MGTFKEKLIQGEQAEDVFYRLMLKKAKPKVAECRLKQDDEFVVERRWDHVVPFEDGRTMSFEVKFDEESEKTGNAAIEYMSLGNSGVERNPSGLWATESDYWVHVVWMPDIAEWRHFYAPVADLKGLLLEEGENGMVPKRSSKGEWYNRVTKNWKTSGQGNPLVGLILISIDKLTKRPWSCLEDIRDGSWDFLELSRKA